MSSVGQIVGRFTEFVINPAITILAAAAFFFFIFGLVQFMIAVSQGAHADEGKRHMLWGIIGMVVMFSVTAILALINNTFNFGINVNTQSNTATYNQSPGTDIQNIHVGGSFQ